MMNPSHSLHSLALVPSAHPGRAVLTSANTSPTSNTSNFGHLLRFSSCGTVFVVTTWSNALALIRSIASPLNTPCVNKAYTFVAPPLPFSSFAARVIVLDVSAISSTRIATFPAISPTSIIVAFCLSVMRVGRRSCLQRAGLVSLLRRVEANKEGNTPCGLGRTPFRGRLRWR